MARLDSYRLELCDTRLLVDEEEYPFVDAVEVGARHVVLLVQLTHGEDSVEKNLGRLRSATRVTVRICDRGGQPHVTRVLENLVCVGEELVASFVTPRSIVEGDVGKHLHRGLWACRMRFEVRS